MFPDSVWLSLNTEEDQPLSGLPWEERAPSLYTASPWVPQGLTFQAHCFCVCEGTQWQARKGLAQISPLCPRSRGRWASGLLHNSTAFLFLRAVIGAPLPSRCTEAVLQRCPHPAALAPFVQSSGSTCDRPMASAELAPCPQGELLSLCFAGAIP